MSTSRPRTPAGRWSFNHDSPGAAVQRALLLQQVPRPAPSEPLSLPRSSSRFLPLASLSLFARLRFQLTRGACCTLRPIAVTAGRPLSSIAFASLCDASVCTCGETFDVARLECGDDDRGSGERIIEVFAGKSDTRKIIVETNSRLSIITTAFFKSFPNSFYKARNTILSRRMLLLI